MTTISASASTMADTCVRVSSLLSQEGGICYAVAYVLTDGVHEEEKHGHVFKEDAVRLGLCAGNVYGLDVAKELARADDLFCAVRSAMGTLNYGPKPPRALIRRLKEKGYAEDVASSAVDWLVLRGFLNVQSGLEQDVHAALSKLRGPVRIRQDLFAKGYTADDLAVLDDLLADVDFVSLCTRFIATRVKSLPTEPKEKQKLIAACLRAGFTYATVKEALKDFSSAS